MTARSRLANYKGHSISLLIHLWAEVACLSNNSTLCEIIIHIMANIHNMGSLISEVRIA